MDKAVSYHLNAYLARFYPMSSLGSPFSSLGQRKKKRLLFRLYLSSGDNLASGRFLNQSNVLVFVHTDRQPDSLTALKDKLNN